MADDAITLEIEKLTKDTCQGVQEVTFPSASAAQLYDSLPIPTGSLCVRLLDLDASITSGGWTPNARLTGTLRVVNLNSAPSFSALSYVWGEPKPHAPCTIVCQDGCELPITASCHQSLWHIRKHFGTMTLWVDSICINQDNDDEKPSQISMMQGIFSQAKTVYIWLGLGDETSDRAMDFLRRRARLGRCIPLAALAPEVKNPLGTRDLGDSWHYSIGIWKDLLVRRTGRLWRSQQSHAQIQWKDLLDRDWVHRSWTFQELMLAARPVILCGDKILWWEDLVSAICCKAKGMTKDLYPLPSHSAVLEHWRSMIYLWLRLPRIPAVTRQTASAPEPLSRSILDLVKERSANRSQLPVLFRAFVKSLTIFLSLCLAALYGFITYKMGIATATTLTASNLDGLWFIVVLAWIVVTLCYLGLSISLLVRWNLIAYGWDQSWILEQGSDLQQTDTAAILDEIRGALRERDSSRHHDRAFALGGILTLCGASPIPTNYSLGVGHTYQALLEQLLSWQSSSLIMLLDAGGPSRPDRPTWVPNWEQGLKPNRWLSVKYRLGSSAANATPLKGSPTFKISGSLLQLRGQRIGEVVFRTNFDPQARADDSRDHDTLQQWLVQLFIWFRAVKKTVSPRSPYDYPVSFIFAILEGLTPKRGPSHKIVKKKVSRSMPGVYKKVHVRLPELMSPYDFRQHEDNFEKWKELYQILDSHATSAQEDTSAIVKEVTGNAMALDYLTRVIRIILADGRCLFVLSGKRVGTGPLEMQLGDEAYKVAGVPCPLTLRRKVGQESLSIVGATLVHGLMHGGNFEEDELQDILLA
ncbi:hypothetical protein GQ53DRAFT_858553 [Thozetella sp. PMI_491]|nr:hypothetical protein GQ53DRAFT_858553 [Thozetella sp. PMI_491]